MSTQNIYLRLRNGLKSIFFKKQKKMIPPVKCIKINKTDYNIWSVAAIYSIFLSKHWINWWFWKNNGNLKLENKIAHPTTEKDTQINYKQN